MEFKDLVKKRYSVREFKSEAVERDKIEIILEAGRMAPSAVNFQPWYFIVVRDPNILSKLHECYTREWFKTAPVVIVICGDHSQAWHRKSDAKDHTDVDAAIAVDHMTLQAADIGLGSCWVCNLNPYTTKDVLGLPSHIEPIAMLPIGYPSENTDLSSMVKKRKPFNEIVSWDKFEA